jgi:hypothetical protein
MPTKFDLKTSRSNCLLLPSLTTWKFRIRQLDYCFSRYGGSKELTLTLVFRIRCSDLLQTKKAANVIGTMELIGSKKKSNASRRHDWHRRHFGEKPQTYDGKRSIKRVRAICTHAILSGDAYEKIGEISIIRTIVPDQSIKERI